MGTPSAPSLIVGSPGAPPTVDAPIVQDATFANSQSALRQYRGYLDSQALGVQTHLVQSLLGGLTATWMRCSQAVAKGQWVTTDGGGGVVPALSAALALAGQAFGIALVGGAAGSWIRVALGGAVPSSVSGLLAGSALFACVNTTTGFTTTKTSLASTDYPVGTVDAGGTLTVHMQFPSTALNEITPADYASGAKLYVEATETKLGVTPSTDGAGHLDSFVAYLSGSGTIATMGINGAATNPTGGSAACDFSMTVTGWDSAANGNYWRGDLLFTALWAAGTVTLYNASGSQTSISAQTARSNGTNGASYTAAATISGHTVIVSVSGTPVGAPPVKWSCIGQLQWTQ